MLLRNHLLLLVVSQWSEAPVLKLSVSVLLLAANGTTQFKFGNFNLPTGRVALMHANRSGSRAERF